MIEKFEIGMRVRHIADGSVGTVVSLKPPHKTNRVRVKWDKYSATWNMPSMLEMVEP